MSWKRFSLIVVVFVATIAVPTLNVSADEPVNIRYFAEMTSLTADGRDWEAEDSRRIVTHAKGNDAPVIVRFVSVAYTEMVGDDPEPYMIRDAAGNVVLDLRGTEWVQTPIIHVTDDGVEEVRNIYWLREVGKDKPLAGVTCRTGPQGDVLTVQRFRMWQLPVNDLCAPGHWIATGDTDGTTAFSISLGMFNK